MARLLPLRSETPQTQSGPRVLDLDDEETDEVFSALSSDTARSIYRCLHQEPNTPSEVADRVDTSIQNVRYHLENLEDAGLIEVVDTWYSSRGNEMSVYAPASDALVLAADEEEASRLRTALSRLLGGVAVLAMASLVVQEAVRNLLDRPLGSGSAQRGGGNGGAAGGAGAATTDGGEAELYADDSSGTTVEADAAPESTATDGGYNVADATTAEAATDTRAEATGTQVEATGTEVEATRTAAGTQTEVATETAAAESTTAGTEAMDVGANASGTTTAPPETTTVTDAVVGGGGDAVQTAGAGLDPGLLFFAGGFFVLAIAVGYWYHTGQ
jgi:DNA-binding transcriptional ArsR family regulator